MYIGPLPQLYGPFLHIFQLRSFQIIILQTFLIAIIVNNNIGKYLFSRQKIKKKKEIANFCSREITSKLVLFQKRSVSIKFHMVKWSLLIKVSYAKLLLIFMRFISFWEFKTNNWFFNLFHNFYQVNLELSPFRYWYNVLKIRFYKFSVYS